VSTPSITGVTTSSLSQVNPYRNRLFFVQGGTMNVWALPVASLGGAAIQISLSGVFQLGGSVLFTATWSLDSGSGLDDNLVIVSTEGEIAIYNGSDPSDPNNWSLVGVYSGPRPLGKNGFTKEGSTLEILTEKGLIPITAMINRSKDEISPYAHSRAIEPDWVKEAAARASVPWEIVKWPIKQRTVINVPAVGTVPAKPFMVNTTTGAWCSRPGWDTRCIWLYQNFVYFGTTTGTVMQMEITGSDNGSPYYPVMVLAWDNYGTPGFQKTVMSMRAIFTVTSPVVPLLSISSDYVISLPNPPTIPANTTPSSLWDVGLWDSALWDNAAVPVNYDTGWETIGQSGYAVAAQLQLSIGNTAVPDIELITMQAIFETGEIMVPT
jgi:hypothetical protein